MPIAVDVWVFPLVDCLLPHPCSDKLHAAIFNVARAKNADLTTKIHEMEELKPFTLSTLWPRNRLRSGDSLSIAANTGCRFRMCMLTTEAAELFLATLSALLAEGGTIRIGRYDFKLHAVEINEKTGAVNYAELPEEMSTAVLKFLSPTTFRRAGMSYPLPDPILVFSSLWRKWQAFSDYHFEEQLFDELSAALALARAEIKTRTWKFPRYQLNGFTGAAEFSLIGTVSTDVRLLFGALANYAQFASVGLRTTMGLGQCRILPKIEIEEKTNDE